MNTYKGYLIDLDGTMYRGKEKIEAASEFIQALKGQHIPYLFVTNNSSKRPDQVIETLKQFQIDATTEQIVTSSMATASFISKQKTGASVYFIGEDGLDFALKEQGLTMTDENPDYVVVGLDRKVTYEKLAKACIGIRNGATFISTNSDIALPTERGLLPGNGAITAAIAVSTNVQPLYIGKPEPIIMEEALNKIGMQKEEVCMVGDNYHTDILAGIRSGIDTLFVHTGVTKKEELEKQAIGPTHVVESLGEWMPKL